MGRNFVWASGLFYINVLKNGQDLPTVIWIGKKLASRLKLRESDAAEYSVHWRFVFVDVSLAPTQYLWKTIKTPSNLLWILTDRFVISWFFQGISQILIIWPDHLCGLYTCFWSGRSLPYWFGRKQKIWNFIIFMELAVKRRQLASVIGVSFC